MADLRSSGRSPDPAIKSNAQLNQDMLCLMLLDYKTNGYCVEVGANDGLLISNTLILERAFNWKSLLIEPDPTNFAKLKLNRPLAICVNRACSSQRGVMDFTVVDVNNGVLSGLTHCIDTRLKQAYPTTTIQVETDTLVDILDDNNAPIVIDFISIDTEGSEMEIIKTKNLFKRYRFKIIMIEHNFRPDRAIVRAHLKNSRYTCIFENNHDDVYVHDSYVDELCKNYTKNWKPPCATE